MTRTQLAWLASYPRSGNTWARFLLSAYIYGAPRRWQDQNRAGSTIHYLAQDCRSRGTGERGMLEMIEASLARFPREAGFPRTSIVKTHFACTDEHPLLTHAASVIHLIRDPRSVALSGLSHHRSNRPGQPITDEAYFDAFVRGGGDARWIANGYGTWESHASSWQEQRMYPVLLVRYEDLLSDTPGELRRVLEFLEFPVDESRLALAVESTSAAHLSELEQRGFAEGLFGSTDRSRRIIRAGKAAGGGEPTMADLGAPILERFRARFEQSMARFGYFWSPDSPSIEERVPSPNPRVPERAAERSSKSEHAKS